MRVLAVCGLGFEAVIARGPGVTALCAPGPARAEAALEAALEATLEGAPQAEPGAALEAALEVVPEASLATARAPSPRARGCAGIISFGCAGALDPALAVGSCVVARGVLDGGEWIPADPAWARALRERLPGACCGIVAGVDAPLASSRDKARWWRTSGAVAVDMESAAAAKVARRHGLPFAVCRVVLDPAWRSLPPCVLAALRDDGSAAPLALLRALGADPRQLAPLCALAGEAWLARRTLRRVRARLGAALALPAAAGAADRATDRTADG